MHATRRTMLGTAAALALVGRARAAVGPVAGRLSAYMAAAGDTPLPDAVATQARLHLLDTLGAIVSGATLPPGRAAIAFARAYGGTGPATVAASGLSCLPIEAALANAVLAHSDETDDSNAPAVAHPGASVVPAALAAGQQFGITGARLLRAVALGYDVGARMSLALGPKRVRDAHRSTHALASVWGSAAAAGCAAGLDAPRMRALLDYTAQQSSGIASWQRDPDHIEKAFTFAGMGARNGVTAALLVQLGWTGVDDVLSGEDSVLDAYGPADAAALTDALGTRFEIARTDMKKWTVGSPIQAPLDGLAALLAAHRFRPDDVKEVVVHVATSKAGIVDERAIPDINLQHMLAVMLLDGTASFAAAHDVPRMQDPAVLAQRAKIRLQPDDELERLLPRREAIVDVVLADGRRLTERVRAVRGTAENPMTGDEVAAKVRDLVTPVLGAPGAEALIDRVLHVDAVPDVRQLAPLLAPRT